MFPMNHREHPPQTLIADFTTGNVNRQLITFAMPMFLSHLLQIVYNMADMIIVGQTLGKVGLSAISVGGDIMNCMTFIAMGFSNAGQVLIAQYIGAKQHAKVSRFVATMGTTLLCFALGISGLGLSILFGLVLDMKYMGFWLGDALANFTPLWIGMLFYHSGAWKRKAV